MRGGSPASIGNSVRSRCANACSVQIAAASSSSRAAAHAASTRRVPFELFPHPVTQLGRGLLGERDRRDRPHRDTRADQRDDAVDERRRLARARARLDEQRVGQVGPDLGARRRVGIVGRVREQRQLRVLLDRRELLLAGHRRVGHLSPSLDAHQRDVLGELGGRRLAHPIAVAIRSAQLVGIAVVGTGSRSVDRARAAGPGSSRPRCRSRSVGASRRTRRPDRHRRRSRPIRLRPCRRTSSTRPRRFRPMHRRAPRAAMRVHRQLEPGTAGERIVFADAVVRASRSCSRRRTAGRRPRGRRGRPSLGTE